MGLMFSKPNNQQQQPYQQEQPPQQQPPPQQQHRLVSKNGESLIKFKISTKERILAYARDSFTSFVDMKWRYHFLGFFGTFFSSWILFGLIWYATVDTKDKTTNSTMSSCVAEVFSMGEAILFSYESQSTVGYGSRYLLSECNFGGYVLQFLQIVVGIMAPCVLGGIVFTKTRRPKRRIETIVFSEIATIFDELVIERSEIGERDKSEMSSKIKKKIMSRRKKKKTFQFRIGNIRQSNIIATSVRVILVKERRTNEGEVIPFCMHQLPITTTYEGRKEDEESNPSLVFLPWPVMVSHDIDELSPLKDARETGLKFEIIVLFEGTVESTGKPSQFRTSYIPEEIVWQHRFAPLVMEFKRSTGVSCRDVFSVDYSTFNQTIPVHRAMSREHIITKAEDTKEKMAKI